MRRPWDTHEHAVRERQCVDAAVRGAREERWRGRHECGGRDGFLRALASRRCAWSARWGRETPRTRTERTRAGPEPSRVSKTCRTPPMLRLTIPAAPVQVFPICWCSTPAPSVHVVTALRDSTSPGAGQHGAVAGTGNDVQSLTVQSAELVTTLLLSNAHAPAYCGVGR